MESQTYRNSRDISRFLGQTKDFWLGFSDEGRPFRNFSSVSNPNVEIQFKYFMSGRPSTHSNYNCIKMNMKTGQWIDDYCHYSRYVACMISRSALG